MIRCRVARRFVDAALERELTLEQRFQLEEHNTRCPACAEHERRARSLQELLEGPGDPPPTLPDVQAATRAVLHALAGGGGRERRPRRAPRAALLVAGVLALASAAAVLLVLRERHEPSPDSPATPAAPDPAWTAASVEAAVRAALLASFQSTGVDPARARGRFHEDLREPMRSGWPVRRFVEGLLECPDPTVALAAARGLGILGEASAAPALERALARADLAHGALEALGALGEPAVAVLERALARPGLAPGVLLQLCRVGGPRAADVLERAARSARDGSNPSREALLDALTTTGPAAVASLLRLASERACERSESNAILARLPLVAGAGPELVRCFDQERFSGELAYRALQYLQPSEALPWLEERCATHRERAPALETLAGFPGRGPLTSVLRVAQGGRVPREEVLRLLVGLLERDAERAEALSRELAARDQGDTAQAWLALLIESEHPSAGQALVPLVFSAALAGDERLWAALAVGELGTPEDARRLALELGARASEDRRLTAACLLSIHALLGAQGVEQLLERCSTASARRVLAALGGEGRSGDAVLLHRVARALDGALGELAKMSADPEGIL